MNRSVCPYLGTVDADYNRGPHMDYPSFENLCMAVDDSADDDMGQGNTLMLTDQATYCLSSGHIYCPRYRAARAANHHAPTQMDHPHSRYDTPNPPTHPTPIYNPSAHHMPDTGSTGPFPTWTDSNSQPRFDTLSNPWDIPAWEDGVSGTEQRDERLDDLLDDYFVDDYEDEPPLLGSVVGSVAGSVDLGGRWAWLSAGMLFLTMLLCGAMLAIYTGWDIVSQRAVDQAALAQRQANSLQANSLQANFPNSHF